MVDLLALNSLIRGDWAIPSRAASLLCPPALILSLSLVSADRFPRCRIVNGESCKVAAATDLCCISAGTGLSFSH